jgi:hypothetical protein
MNSNLTDEEKIEKSYLDKGVHKECVEGLYSKGEMYIKKLYSNQYCEIDINLFGSQNKFHFCGINYGEMGHSVTIFGCDNCIELWKRDEKLG